MLNIRLRQGERSAIEEAAIHSGVDVSEWARRVLLAEQAPKLSEKPKAINSWTYDGGLIRVQTPEDISRDQWERLRQYVAILEPNPARSD